MMEKRLLGSTGLEVSALGFGAWAIGGNSYGTMDDKESLRALETAFDEGVNFIDTADVYGKGHSEELIGKAIRGRRDKVVVATKAGWDFYPVRDRVSKGDSAVVERRPVSNGVYRGLIKRNFSPSYLSFAVEESLRRLGVDSLDLFQLHNPPTELASDQDLLEALRRLRQAGKIRFCGVSVHGPEEGRFWIEHTDVQTVQIAFNLLDQRPAWDGFFALAQEEGRGLIAREPLACGMLTDKYREDVVFSKNDHRRRWPREKIQSDLEKIKEVRALLSPDIPLSQAALEFVLSFLEISSAIPGMKTPSQVRENLRAVCDRCLGSETIEGLRGLAIQDEIFSKGFYRN